MARIKLKTLTVPGPVIDSAVDETDSPETIPPIDETDLAFPVQPAPEAVDNLERKVDGAFEFPVQAPALQGLYSDASQVDPERAAKVAKISERMAAPQDFVDKNLAGLEAVQKAPPSSFFAEIEKKYPGTLKILSQPDIMAATHDDMENLKQHEQVVQEFTAAHGVVDSFEAGWQGSNTGLRTRAKMPNMILPENAGVMDQVASFVGDFIGNLPTFIAGGKIGAVTAVPAATAVGGALAGPPGALAAATFAAPLGGIAGAFAFTAAVRAKLIDDIKKGEIKNTEDLMQRVNNVTSEFAKQGLVGLITGKSGELGSKLVTNIAVPTVMKSMAPAASLAVETVTKKTVPIITEAAGMTVGSGLVEGRLPTEEEYLHNLVIIGGMHAVGAGGAALSRQYSKSRVQADVKLYDGIQKLAETAKLGERLPEKYSEYIGDLVNGTKAENVYMSRDVVNEYFQSKGIDPAEAAEKLGAGESYRAAQATGGDVQIKYKNWVTEFGKTEHYQALKNDLKFDKNGLTINERMAAEKAMEQAAEAVTEQPATSGFSIESDIISKLQAVGRGVEESQAAGKLHQSYFGRLGEILELDPNELYKKYNLEVTNQPGRPESKIGGELLQDNQGSITFTDSKQATIKLLESADKSTFLHESGHLFLEAHKDALSILSSAKELTSQQIKFLEDSSALKDYLGVKDLSELKTEHHEKFARSWEEYLREGKAPSTGLKRVFQKFSKWLNSIYMNSKVAGIELSPQIREVFDRMMANQAEIEAASRQMGLNKPAVESKQISELVEEARIEAQERLLKEQLKDTTDEHKKFLADERVKFTKQAEKQILEQQPVFRATKYLEDHLTRKDIGKLANGFLEGKLKLREQIEFEKAAELNNFINGKDLAEQIQIAEANQLLKIETKRLADEMMEQHAGLLDPQTLHEHALEVLHTEKTAELISLEQQILNEKLSKDPGVAKITAERRKQITKIEKDKAKSIAKEIIGKKATKDASDFRPFITAERKAAERAAKYAAKGDLEAAANAKREQLINHELAREAMRARDELKKSVPFLEKVAKRGDDLMNMAYGFTRQVDKLLSLTGFREPIPENLIEFESIARVMETAGESAYEIADRTGQVKGERGEYRSESLPEFLERLKTNFYPLDVDPGLFNLAKIDYRDMSLDQFRAMHDAVKEISYTGKIQDKFLTLFDKVSIKEAALKASQQIRENVSKPFEGDNLGGAKFESEFKNKLDAITKMPSNVLAPNLVNLLTMCEYLDRLDVKGPMKEFVYRVLKNAEDTKHKKMSKAKDDLKNLQEKHFESGEMAKLSSEKVRLGQDGRYYSKAQILHMALNLGNETSRNRIEMGLRLSLEESVDAINKNLTKKHMDYVQSVWDYLHEYWPEAKELEMRTAGVEPQAVQPLELVTEHGTYKGGYYPLEYDASKSVDTYQTAQTNTVQFQQLSKARATTNRGHMKGRLDNLNRVVKLTPDVLTNHLEQTIHDLSFREAAIDVNRFMSQKNVERAITDAIGNKGFKSIIDSANAIIGGDRESLGTLDRWADQLRYGVTFAKLGFKFVNYPMDITGNLINTIWEVGPRKAAQGISNYVAESMRSTKTGEPNRLKEFVIEKSARMKNRLEQGGKDRDIRELSRKWEGEDSMIKRFAFFFQMAADEHMSLPMWAEVYKNAVSKYGEKLAIDIADEAVTKAFGSGSILDQSAVQRGRGVKKLMTMYYSWAGMMFNRMWLEGKLSKEAWTEGNTNEALAGAAKALLFGVGLQALNENFWKELFRNSQGGDTDKKRNKRITARFAQQGFSYVPVLRDFADAYSQYYQRDELDFSLTPAESALDEILKSTISAGKVGLYGLGSGKAPKEKDAENIAKAAAIILKYPQKANDIGFNLLDFYFDKGDLAWRDILNRRVK